MINWIMKIKNKDRLYNVFKEIIAKYIIAKKI